MCKQLTALAFLAVAMVGLNGLGWCEDAIAEMSAVHELQTAPVMSHPTPKQTEEHQWLQQFVGQWQSTTVATMPGMPAIQMTGTETVKPVGQYWTVTEVSSSMMNQPFNGQMTLGYNADENEFVGTWVDSMTGQLWQYEGELEDDDTKLVLEGEGTCPIMGKNTKFRETLQWIDADNKRYTSEMLNDDGEWVTTMVSKAIRVK